MKQCSACKTPKPPDDFYSYITKRTHSTYTFPRCKSCMSSSAYKTEKKNRKIKYSNTWLRRKLYRRFYNYKSRSKKNGWECDLTLKIVKNIIQEVCIYCGDNTVMSIDRKDNKIGYLQTNCVPACYSCNTIKSNKYTFEEMLILGEVIKKIRTSRKF